MKISIITVCFNSVVTLEDTIISVINQTYDNFEYIIIDGNSTDGTLNIIKKYEQYISKWISEPDYGLYDAMNKGISLSTGNIVGLLNSDDTFTSNSVLENIASFHLFNEIEASYGNVLQSDQSGKLVRFYSSKNWKPTDLRFGYMPPHPSIFLKRELFEKFGYYNLSFKIGADYEFITRYFLVNKINSKYSGLTTTNMLVGGVSSSGLNSYITITNEIIKALKLNGIRFHKTYIRLRFIWKIFDFLFTKRL